MTVKNHVNPKLKQMYEKNNRFFIILSVLLLILTGYFSYKYFSKLNQIKDDIISIEKVGKDLSAQLDDSNVDFATQTEIYTQRRTEHLSELNKVFPVDAEKTNFTRFIDDYFFRNNFLSNEIFLKSMVYGSASAEEDYYVLPVSMSVTSSKSNFINFLKYVEGSGALQSNVRVMDVKSIDVTFREDERKNRLYDYRISLNLYYQNNKAIPEA